MTDLILTRHAEARLRQRGLRESDIALAMEIAAPVGEDAWLLTYTAAADEVARLRGRIQRIQRLRGLKVVNLGDRVRSA